MRNVFIEGPKDMVSRARDKVLKLIKETTLYGIRKAKHSDEYFYALDPYLMKISSKDGSVLAENYRITSPATTFLQSLEETEDGKFALISHAM